MNLNLKIIKKQVKDLIPYINNARTHDEGQVEQIAASIKEFGFNNPILLDGSNGVIAGHGRLMAAKKLGLKEVPCIELSHLSEAQKKAYILADNKIALNAGWDEELLKIELSDLDDNFKNLIGFSDEELNNLLDSIDETGESGYSEISAEAAEEVPEKVETKCKLGDLWQLGEHRLLCGDSTDENCVKKLMGNEKADMVFTDPPYNVAIGSKNAVLNEKNHAKKGNRIEQDIEGDKGMTDEEIGKKLWEPAFRNMADFAKDCCSIYVTMPQGGTHMIMMMKASWQVKHELMWLKNQPTFSMGRLDYDYQHEPIMYGWKKTHKFYGKGNFNKSVWTIDKPRESKLHPTMKPIELIVNALMNSSIDNDVILDLFGGSGSTLIACEQTRRKARLMELAPHYCDVIIQRWENLTGRKAVLLSEKEQE